MGCGVIVFLKLCLDHERRAEQPGQPQDRDAQPFNQGGHGRDRIVSFTFHCLPLHLPRRE